MSSLSDEQRKMIEEKKKAAQAKLAAKFAQKSTLSTLQQSVKTTQNNNQCTLSKPQLVLSPSPSYKNHHINYNNSLQNCKPKRVHGTCELISKERFTVHVSYHQQLIDTFKTIQSKNYGEFVNVFKNRL